MDKVITNIEKEFALGHMPIVNILLQKDKVRIYDLTDEDIYQGMHRRYIHSNFKIMKYGNDTYLYCLFVEHDIEKNRSPEFIKKFKEATSLHMGKNYLYCTND